VDSLQQYLLYCPCRQFGLPSRWDSSDIRTCKVTNSVYRRGFGSSEEVIFADQQAEALQHSASKDFEGRKTGGHPAARL